VSRKYHRRVGWYSDQVRPVSGPVSVTTYQAGQPVSTELHTEPVKTTSKKLLKLIKRDRGKRY